MVERDGQGNDGWSHQPAQPACRLRIGVIVHSAQGQGQQHQRGTGQNWQSQQSVAAAAVQPGAAHIDTAGIEAPSQPVQDQLLAHEGRLRMRWCMTLALTLTVNRVLTVSVRSMAGSWCVTMLT